MQVVGYEYVTIAGRRYPPAPLSSVDDLVRMLLVAAVARAVVRRSVRVMRAVEVVWALWPEREGESLLDLFARAERVENAKEANR